MSEIGISNKAFLTPRLNLLPPLLFCFSQSELSDDWDVLDWGVPGDPVSDELVVPGLLVSGVRGVDSSDVLRLVSTMNLSMIVRSVSVCKKIH